MPVDQGLRQFWSAPPRARKAIKSRHNPGIPGAKSRTDPRTVRGSFPPAVPSKVSHAAPQRPFDEVFSIGTTADQRKRLTPWWG